MGNSSYKFVVLFIFLRLVTLKTILFVTHSPVVTSDITKTKSTIEQNHLYSIHPRFQIRILLRTHEQSGSIKFFFEIILLSVERDIRLNKKLLETDSPCVSSAHVRSTFLDFQNSTKNVAEQNILSCHLKK